MQLRFTLFVVINLRRDFHPQVCAHAGRTIKKGTRRCLSDCPQAVGDQAFLATAAAALNACSVTAAMLLSATAKAFLAEL